MGTVTRVSAAQQKRNRAAYAAARQTRAYTAVILAEWVAAHGYVHPDDLARFNRDTAAMTAAWDTYNAGKGSTDE
jgi:hypothetical protein